MHYGPPHATTLPVLASAASAKVCNTQREAATPAASYLTVRHCVPWATKARKAAPSLTTPAPSPPPHLQPQLLQGLQSRDRGRQRLKLVPMQAELGEGCQLAQRGRQVAQSVAGERELPQRAQRAHALGQRLGQRARGRRPGYVWSLAAGLATKGCTAGCVQSGRCVLGSQTASNPGGPPPLRSRPLHTCSRLPASESCVRLPRAVMDCGRLPSWLPCSQMPSSEMRLLMDSGRACGWGSRGQGLTEAPLGQQVPPQPAPTLSTAAATARLWPAQPAQAARQADTPPHLE